MTYTTENQLPRGERLGRALMVCGALGLFLLGLLLLLMPLRIGPHEKAMHSHHGRADNGEAVGTGSGMQRKSGDVPRDVVFLRKA